MSTAPNPRDRELPAWWTTVLKRAIASDRNTVQIEIDGGAYPIETFTIGDQKAWLHRLTSEGRLKVEAVSHGA